MTVKKVTVVAGEDAAPEAMEPSVELLDRMGLGIEWIWPLVGKEALARGLPHFPDEARAQIDSADATFFGATSGATVPVLFYLRWGKETFANVRPTRWIPGFRSSLANPQGIDLVIIRENLEDAYVRIEGDVAALAPLNLTSGTSQKKAHELGEGKFSIKVVTRNRSEQVLRFGFELARRRKSQGLPGKITVAAKWNMLPQTDGLFLTVAKELSEKFPDIPLETLIVDDFAHRLVTRPQSFDVVVLQNLYGDILSDAAAGLAGGLGLAASGCYGRDYAYFESVHGTAPDIAGKGIINPTATLLSAVLMLDYLGYDQASRSLQQAIEAVYKEGRYLTPDQGGRSPTREFCNAVGGKIK
ncbi:MAG: isocitrate/isopropylmalate family dehydrogenase [Thermodesulfobacteriota bacterium]